MPASVKGGIELRKALRKFTPDLAKETQQKIGGALKPIVKSAKGYLPDDSSVLSGWLPRENSQGNFPTYTARVAKAGIGYKTTPSKPNSKGFRSLARVFNKSAAGAIYETMGRKTPSSRFVQNQTEKYGSQMKGNGKMDGRALYRAYEENQGKAKDAVLDAIKIAGDKLNSRASVRG
jgi:hypothetical protein